MAVKPEERARRKIDRFLKDAGWDVVSRQEYVPRSTAAVEEALMSGNTESDYLLFIDNKAIAVLEAKQESNQLGPEVADQAENYAYHPQDWYGLWFYGFIPLAFLSNGNKIIYRDLRQPQSEYREIDHFPTPKQMLRMIGEISEYGALPRLEKKDLRDCQYRTVLKFEESLKDGKKRIWLHWRQGQGKHFFPV